MSARVETEYSKRIRFFSEETIEAIVCLMLTCGNFEKITKIVESGASEQEVNKELSKLQKACL